MILNEYGGWTFKYDGQTYNSKWRYLLGDTPEAPAAGRLYTSKYAFHTQPLGDYTTDGKYGYTSSNITMTELFPSVADSVAKATGVKTTPKEKNSYDTNVFYEVERLIGKYSKVSSGTGEIFVPTSFNKQTQYREAIIDIGATYNILVNDHVVYNEDLIKLIAAAKEKGNTDRLLCFTSNNI